MTAKRQQFRADDMKHPLGAARRLQRAFDDVNDRISGIPARRIVTVEFTTATPVTDTPPIGLPELEGEGSVVGMIPIQCMETTTSPPVPTPPGSIAWDRASTGQYRLYLDWASPLLGARPYRMTIEVIYGV